VIKVSEKIVFGPVPSRRLGRSLGVNNIPYKHCTYSCVYCQIGKTLRFEIERQEYYNPKTIITTVITQVKRFGEEKIDYITFVPDGEPTLDINLGKEIVGIKNETTVKVAVITNGSLIYRDDVKEDLYNADTVSIKVDAVTLEIFRKINRAHPKLKLECILNGIIDFSKRYLGKILTETMLVKGINDNKDELENIAKFLSRINVEKSYIAIPTRPPAEPWVKPADEQAILMAHEIFSKYLGEAHVELLTGYEGASFENISEDPIQGLLAITAVHPMRIDYAYKYLSERNLEPKEVISNLLKTNKLVKLKYMNYEFLLHKTNLD